MFQICQTETNSLGGALMFSVGTKMRRVGILWLGLSTVASALLTQAALPTQAALLAQPALAAQPPVATKWWQNAVIYEIYPRSFQDSNADGVGDLNGIAQRLDYLQGLGVDAIWIAPMFPSPQVDFGYDVADYENIDPQYGTLADFGHLLAEARQRSVLRVDVLVVGYVVAEVHLRDRKSTRLNSSHR